MKEHQIASDNLRDTYAQAKYFANQLKPLSEEKKKRIIAKILQDLDRDETDKNEKL
jgi:gamma-glutamyl phosphate reductase